MYCRFLIVNQRCRHVSAGFVICLFWKQKMDTFAVSWLMDFTNSQEFSTFNFQFSIDLLFLRPEYKYHT
jgi:hypothetical protein